MLYLSLIGFVCSVYSVFYNFTVFFTTHSWVHFNLAIAMILCVFVNAECVLNSLDS